MKRTKLKKLSVSDVIDGWKLYDGRTLLVIKKNNKLHEFAFKPRRANKNETYSTSVSMPE